MQSTAPSTPPQQQDLSKMNQPPSQTMYVPSGGANGTTNIRQTQQNMFRGGSSGSGQRAPRHSLPLQPGPFISQQMPPMMVQPPSYHAQYTTQRQPASQMFPPSQQYQLQQASFPANYTSYPSYISYSIQQQQRSVGVPSGIVPAAGPGLGGPNTAQQHIPMQSNNMLATIPTAATATGSNTLNNKKRRKHAIKIIDPITNRNILDEFDNVKPHQSGTSITPEVGYSESLGHTVDVIGGPMHGIAEASSTVSEPLLSGVNLGTSNANNAQGTFIDLMNQHKISAVVPPVTQPPSSVLSINESLNQTPVVSAMSDGPSVEIPPKQQSSKSKRTKSNDSMQQQPDKMSDTKDLSPMTQPPTAAKTAEEPQESSLKNTGRESTSPLPSQVDASVKENHIVELTNQTKNAYTDNQNQNIPAIPTQRLKQLEQSQSASNSGANDSISSDAEIISAQPDNSFNKGTGLIISQPSGGLHSSDVSCATQFLPSYKENNKKNTNNIQSVPTSASNNNVNKIHREKDKIQQASSSNNNSGVAAIGSTSDPNIEQIVSPNYNSNTNSSNHNNNRLASTLNNSNQTKGEKMKLNDKSDISSTVVSNKVISTSNVSEKNNNKKISDKNDNIIPSKSNHQNQKHQRQSQQRAVTVKESQQQSDSVSSNYNTNLSGSTKTSSLCPSNPPPTWNKLDVDMSKANQNTVMNLVASSTPVTSQAPQNDGSVDETDRANLPAVVTVNKGCFINETSPADSNADRYGSDLSKKTFEPKLANTNDVKIKSSDVEIEDPSDKNSNLIDQSVSELQTKEKHESSKISSLGSDGNKIDKSANQEQSNEKSGHSCQLPEQSHENVKSTDEQENSPLVSTQTSNGSNKVESSSISTNVLKSYDREQLLELKDAPLSRLKPKVNNAALSILEIGVKPSQTSLMPSFARGPSGKRQLSNSGMSLSSGNNSGGHQFLKQSSMSGVNAKSNAKGSKSGLIHVSLSLREDVKLNETENAWRPTRLKRDENVPESERSKDELLRKVRGILNKLTPEKFNTLVDQMMKLQIDTQEKINGVMILVFEKAIDEPNFSVSYARLCLHLAENKLASEVKKDGQKTGSDGKGSNMVLFKSALLDKTQREFTDNVLERKAKEQKLKPLIERLKDCTDPDKRLEIKEILEEEDRKIRRRSGGTVRFIGELFKINMLTPKIIRDCIKNLLEPSSEDKLECLCKLLTTVGDRLEQLPTPKDFKNWSLDSVFKKMQAIVDRKTEWSKQISSRVRFMLQDVIDLRKNKWQSKRNDMNPKTMEQIQKEAESEQYNNQFINSTALPSKKDERRFTGIGAGNSNNVNSNNSGVSGNSNTGSGGYYNKSNRQQSSNDAEVWYTKTSKGSRVIDPTKLGQICTDYDNSKINEERRLGDSAQFQWNRSKDSQKPTTTTSNSFAALSNLDLGRGSNNGPRNRGSYTKSSMERDRYDGRNSRGGSIHGSRENSVSRSSGRNSNVSRSTGTSHPYSVSNTHSSTSRSVKPDVPAAVLSATVEPTLSQKAVLNKFNEDPTKHLEEVINEMVTTAIEVSFSEAIIVGETIPECYRSDFIKIILSSYLHLSKTKEQHREKAAEIVLELYNKKFLTLDHILKGYEQFSMDASDIYIDVPELWKYVFQFIGPLLSESVISLKDLWNENLVDANMGKVFFKHLFMYCTQEIGPNFTRKMWRKSGLSWQTCFSKDDHVQFIKNNNFEFIDADDAPCPVHGEPNMQKIMAKIEKLLKGGKSEDLIIDYINGNIKVIDKLFIRGLTTIVLENALIRSDRSTRLDAKKFNKEYGIPLLQRYIDSREECELECLYAIQVLIHRLEYPQGLLFEIFWALFENDAICQDAFIKWRDSPEERAAGKGVAVKGLNKFFEVIDADSSDENN